MIPDSPNALFYRGRRKVFAGRKKMFYLIEDPGITNCSTSYHYPIHSVTVPVQTGLFRRVDVPVAKDGNVDAGVFPDFCDQRPVGFSLVQLRPGSTMYREGLDP